MKREKRFYENGYWGKIEYWSGLLETAIREQDGNGAALCGVKLIYFTSKQKELDEELANVINSDNNFTHIRSINN